MIFNIRKIRNINIINMIQQNQFKFFNQTFDNPEFYEKRSNFIFTFTFTSNSSNFISLNNESITRKKIIFIVETTVTRIFQQLNLMF